MYSNPIPNTILPSIVLIVCVCVCVCVSNLIKHIGKIIRQELNRINVAIHLL